MDMLKALQNKTGNTCAKLFKLTLCALIMTGVMLSSLQYSNVETGMTNNPDETVLTQSLVAEVERSVTIEPKTALTNTVGRFTDTDTIKANRITGSDTAEANHLTETDIIDPDRLIDQDTVSIDRFTNRNNPVANTTSMIATSADGVKIGLANFTIPTVNTSNSLNLSNPSNSSGELILPKPNYRFSQTLPQSLFTAIVSSPLAMGFNEDTRLAIWQENSQFALVEKAHQFVIMLDPGHGGTDPGSVGHNGLQEKTLTLDIARRAQRQLSENKNVTVFLTRNNDSGMSRQNRVRKVKRSKADMFVSIHLNHLPQADVNLVETFYAAPRNILESMRKQRIEKSNRGMVETSAALNPDLGFTRGSKQLASIMQNRVFDEVIDNNPETNDAGVKEDTLFILTRSFTPGALIELSCLSNVQEAKRLNSPAYREKLATALAKGIQDYLATPAAKHQFGPEV